MLSRSDRSIAQVAAKFAEFGVEIGLFVPTATGLSKSIIDAHSGLRRFLSRSEVHDFGAQPKGPAHKAVHDVVLHRGERTEIRSMSLYRPETKDGDPRFWISKLGDTASDCNLLAMFIGSDGLVHIVNTSDNRSWRAIDDPQSALRQVFRIAPQSDALSELLEMLHEVARRGFVPSLRSGPTGVGFTLESLLGITANSSRAPDFKGIEIKSTRTNQRGRANTRTTLLSKTPDWKRSELDASGMIRVFGYPDPRTGRQQLYCSVNNSPNSLGLATRIGGDFDSLHMIGKGYESALIWPLADLEASLSKKHRETVWVKAAVKTESGREHFHYFAAEHTQQPLISNFGPLLSDGTVEVDLTLSVKESGATRDHGYLFKLWPRDQAKLFRASVKYDLGVS